MVDKRLEENIKKAREFTEIWGNFHRIFKSTLSLSTLDNNKEENFLSTKALVNSRYDDLMDSLGVKPIKRFIKSGCIYNIFSLKNLSIMSDERLRTVDRDWSESSKHLAALLERLERKKRRIEGFNRVAFVLKKGISKLR